ncbi:hypothetical protein CTRI78_v001721 [Colletotrichum trifolii]|uniref:Uncharacterized protein n=1 Tax=Colletotrichum trifolii TaxID=5466 RepID=A0A4R8RNN4_COLTR|nr:hypothetical protein CTRI78_v001721 [Colletotrichum trifolii]
MEKKRIRARNKFPRQTLAAQRFDLDDGGISPAPTAAPQLRRQISMLENKSMGSNTCGFYTNPNDIRLNSRLCPDVASECQGTGRYIGCDDVPATTCLAGTAQECASGKKIGTGTICCRTSVSGMRPECQTFVRVEGDVMKTLLTCREAGVNFSPTLTMYTAEHLVYQPAPETATETEVSSSPMAESVSSAPAAPTSSPPLVMVPTTSPVPEPSSPNDHPAQVGSIVGGVLGGMAILAVAGCIVVWLMVRRHGESIRQHGESIRQHWSSAIHGFYGGHPDAHQTPNDGAFEDQSKARGGSPISPAHYRPETDYGMVCKSPVGYSVGSPNKPAELD